MKEESITKRGYLTDEFRYFHLKDANQETYQYHYHEFYKIVVLISGDISYLIEGVTYPLMPGDILFVPHHAVHKPIIHSNTPYERIIFWIHPSFFQKESLAKYSLNSCFISSNEYKDCLLRLPIKKQQMIYSLLSDMEHSFASTEFAHELYTNLLFQKIMIILNRLHDILPPNQPAFCAPSNKTVDAVISYINQNLNAPLKTEDIAKDLYLSPSYLMHQFKEVTGSTLHTYITRKKLSYALLLMREGHPVTVAASLSGYSDYSTFLRTFRKYYHCTPTTYLQSADKIFPNSGKALIE